MYWKYKMCDYWACIFLVVVTLWWHVLHASRPALNVRGASLFQLNLFAGDSPCARTAENIIKTCRTDHYQCGGVHKWGYPQIIHLGRIVHYKLSILGYPHFWNPNIAYYCMILPETVPKSTASQFPIIQLHRGTYVVFIIMLMRKMIDDDGSWCIVIVMDGGRNFIASPQRVKLDIQPLCQERSPASRHWTRSFTMCEGFRKKWCDTFDINQHLVTVLQNYTILYNTICCIKDYQRRH